MEIAFVVNHWAAFSDSDLEGRGIGGSETAFICLTRTLAGSGHDVTVFNRAGYAGVFNRVKYVPLASFDDSCFWDILVLFRSSYLPFICAKAKRKIFWSTDIDWSDWDEFIFPYVDGVICMSHFHQSFLTRTYRNLNPGRLFELPLGVLKADYFDSPPACIPSKPGNRLLFCSVPERGLEHLARLWPRLCLQFPNIELHITSDYTLWGREAGTEAYRVLFNGFRNVVYHGKVSRSHLVELQKSSTVMAYPCTYHEGFCLAAIECIAAGAVPVTTNRFALTTTVADSGILVEGSPGEEGYDQAFVQAIVDLLMIPGLHKTHASRGRQRVRDLYTWDILAKRFEHICLNGLRQ